MQALYTATVWGFTAKSSLEHGVQWYTGGATALEGPQRTDSPPASPGPPSGTGEQSAYSPLTHLFDPSLPFVVISPLSAVLHI